MQLEYVLSIVSAFGVGSIVTTYITMRYETKRLIFETKLEKYSNLIQALQHAVAEKSSEASRQNYVSCLKQVELIGSNYIIELSEDFLMEVYNFAGRRDDLVRAMRNDLIESRQFFRLKFWKNQECKLQSRQ